MEEKKYLKWYNKVGYGSGDIAGNVVYAFLTSFVMIYLTETVGLASGCMLCGTDKPWQDSTVYVVLSGIHTVKWHFLHGK